MFVGAHTDKWVNTVCTSFMFTCPGLSIFVRKSDQNQFITCG